jgi:hypothetical protein
MASQIKLKNQNGKTLSITNNDGSNSNLDVSYYSTVADLTAATAVDGSLAILTDIDRGGNFIYDSTATDNGGTIFGKWVRQYSGSVNVKWFGSLENYTFFGDGNTTTNSSDSVVTVNRDVDDTIAGNGHCFSDSSDVTRGGNISYASFDARATVAGVSGYGHFAPFQNGMKYSTSGLIGTAYGYVDVPLIDSGTISVRRGLSVHDVAVSGSGAVVNNYGLYIEELTSGTSSDWAVVTKGATKSLFEGFVVNQGGLGSGTVAGNWIIQKTVTDGMRVEAGTGSDYDFSILNNGRTAYIASVATGTDDFKFWGDTRTEGSIIVNGTANLNGSIVNPKINTTIGGGWAIAGTTTSGLRISAGAGTSTDFAILTQDNSQFIATTPTATNDMKLWGKVGFNATNPIAKPTVSGSRGGNAALASLITALASYGLVTDNTTA